MDIFKRTILNTAYIKALEIFLLDRESLSIQTSISRSVSNQSRLHGSWLHQLVWKWLWFLYVALYKKVHGNRYQILKWPFLHHLVIFKDSVNFFMLSTGLLMQGQFSLILIDITQWERVVKMGTFGVKRASDEKFCPSTLYKPPLLL